MATITLTNPSINSGTSVRLLNGELTYGWQNRTREEVSESKFGKVESQFSGWENPVYSITFYIPIDSTPSGTMTWSLWNQFVKNKYSGASTKTTLTLSVGDNTNFTSYALDSTTTGQTDIPVQIKSFSLRLSPGDSRNANFWVINAQLVET